MTRRTLAAATLAGLVGVTVWWSVGRRATPLSPHILVEELVAELPDGRDGLTVERESPHAPVRHGTLRPGDALKTGGGDRAGLVVSPPSRVAWRVPALAGTELRFAVGVEGDGRRDRSRSGIRFAVLVNGRERWAQVLDPAASRRDRRWVDASVPLDAGSDGTAEVTFETAAEEADRPLAGTPGWGHVRVVRTAPRPRQPAAAGPNVVVLLLDTQRADRLGLYGNAPSPSPTLDALGARGLVFTNAVSQSSWTLPSVASLMSGLHPRSHGALGSPGEDGQPRWGFLADRVDTWAEAARRAGVTTMAVSANPLMSLGTNVAQGFETVVELPYDPTTRNWASARDVSDAFLAWLRVNPGWRFAAWLHFMDPHDPYLPPPDLRPAPPPGMRPALAAGDVHEIAMRVDYKGAPPLSADEIAWLRRLYDAELTGLDREIGRLLRALADAGVLEHTVVIVTADHGEEFQEHGRLKHGSQLYEESIHVPLVLVGPAVPAGRVTRVVQGIDLAPTIARLLGVEPPPGPGRDLLAPSPEDGAVMSETASGIAPDGSPMPVAALRTESWKLIDLPRLARRELYDLAADPGERDDRAATDPRAGTLGDRLAATAAALPPPPARSDAPDPALAEKLRQLGYVR